MNQRQKELEALIAKLKDAKEGMERNRATRSAPGRYRIVKENLAKAQAELDRLAQDAMDNEAAEEGARHTEANPGAKTDAF